MQLCPVLSQFLIVYILLVHCKDTTPKIRTKYSQKRNCRPQSQFPHSCVCERLHIPRTSVCLFCCRKICGPILGICKSLADTCVWKLGLKAAQFFFWDYINGIFFAVWVKTSTKCLSYICRPEWNHCSWSTTRAATNLQRSWTSVPSSGMYSHKKYTLY